MSLSLSLLGTLKLHHVDFSFFWQDALCVPVGEGRKTFDKIGIFYLYSLKSKQSFSLNWLKDCPCHQQVKIGSTVKGVTL